MTYEEVTQGIQKSGYRLTTARKSVVNVLCTNITYLGAYDIHHILEQQDIHIGITSIYRVLDLLSSLDLLAREEFGSGGERFRLYREQDSHAHQLVCSHCGKTEELSNCPVSTALAKLESQSGYQIQEHWLRIFGLCPQCQRHRT
ncbi:Fur family transcriptional regulator [Paradesulfitobacterium aromaticivorans]